MKHLRVVACMIMLALAGCDNNDKTAPTTKSEAPAVAQPSPAQDPAQLQKLAQQSQGKALTLLDASEAQLDGAATLVLTFSIPLDPEQDFSRVVHVVDKKSGSVDGAWELAPNLKELRLRHLEPERVLVVTVDPAVKALNNATFGKSYEKTITTRDVQPSVGFASRGSLLPGKIAEGLPVMALNVNHVDVNFFRVKPGSLASFVSQWEYRSSLSNWESDNLLKMADLVYTGRFDLNPARNTREKLLLPLSDIKPLQQAGVYVAVMNQAGHYNYSNAATLFTLSDIGVSVHRYHNRLDIFTQSLENGAARPDRVTLKLDKANYRPGDTMKLHIAAPVAGKGYAMVESSDGPLWWQAIDVPAQGLELTIPVDKTWNRHDLYLSTLVVRPGDKSRSATPKRAVGLLHLPLGDDNRRLDLALESPAKMRPNQPLTVRVKASVKHGEMPKQINVLVSAVDSGVLNITDYATPDPWQAFFGQKRYGADIYDIYGQVIEGQGRLAALRFGGDGDDLKRGGKPPVNHVNIIAQQAQPITLNEQGEGVVTLPIGDFNGELRVMAQAWTADDFGRGESKVVVAAPVIAELNMPRFLAGGDVSRLVLDVTNLTDRPQTLNIALAASGLLELLSQQPQPVNLAPGVRTTLFVPVRALEGFGEGEIQATISGLNLPGETLDAQHKQWQIGVRPAWPAQTVNSGIALAPGESWHVPEQHLANISPATLQGQLLLSGKPPLNLARYIRELKAYPYGCLEQTTSGLFPALYTNAAQLQSLGITGDSDEKRRAAVDIGISRILQMQRDNGGFALWDENGAEEPWLTAYAMDFLIRAGEQGYSVPPEAINRGNERLLRYLQDPGTMLIRYSDNTQASTFAAQAYAALVLARQQKAPLGTLREIWERRSQAASGLPLMQLGIALNTMGDARRGEEAITLALNTPRQDERQWIADYGSSLRDNALMLSLLEENNLRPDAQNALLSSLSEQAFGQRWLSTQENNALFLAAHSRQASAGAWQVQTSLEAQPLSGDKALTRNLDADQLAALEVTNTGSQPLWLRLDSSGYPSSAPEPASNVLQIERQILGTDGQRKSLSSLRSGELVLVWLTVVADRNVPDALVVDLLPAGLELENQNLADSSASLPESGSEVQNLLNQMQQADIQYMEFRDDRFVAAVVVNEGQPVTLVYLARAVTPGTYQLAQPQVESMYAPQWRATGASEGLLIVTP
ncbi:hypothetical protein AB7Y88_004075 [Salmonella enterica]